MTTVLTAHSYTEHILGQLRERSPGVRFARLAQNGDVPEDARDAVVLLRCSMSKPEFSNALSQAPDVRWVHTCTAGFDQLMVPEIIERALLVSRSAETHHIPIAEWAMTGLLAIAKQFPFAHEAQKEKRWIGPKGWPEPVELYGTTMGIIGAGAIGTEIARRAKAFGMTVIATKRTPDIDSPWYDEVMPPTRVHDLLRVSDFIVVACPLTPETRGMLGPEEFAMMKPTAYLGNIARGAIIDEQALITALTTGQIAGAAIDAFVLEPLPPESPLWEIGNLLITPHASGRSSVSGVRGLEEFAVNLELFRKGATLNNMLSDPELGY